MKVVLCDDDYLYEDTITRHLKREFENLDLIVFTTESEFYGALGDLESFDVAVMDINLPWENPMPNPTVRPPEVEQFGVVRAGFRCQRKLHERYPKIPVILYSALPDVELDAELAALPENAHYCGKEGIHTLIELIRNSLKSETIL